MSKVVNFVLHRNIRHIRIITITISNNKHILNRQNHCEKDMKAFDNNHHKLTLYVIQITITTMQ
jgi:hypothetical protein